MRLKKALAKILSNPLDNLKFLCYILIAILTAKGQGTFKEVKVLRKATGRSQRLIWHL